MSRHSSAIKCTNRAFLRVLGQTLGMKNMSRDSSHSQRILSDAESANLTYLHRKELTLILNTYGRMVANGVWKDYAIDTLKDEAIFSIFKHAAEMPTYRIIKQPSLANKQGAWRILSMSGQILKRGKDLAALLRYFDKLTLKIID